MKLKIEQDEDPQNPRTEWDNIGKMVCFHKQYCLGDKTDLMSGDFNGWDELEEHLKQEHGLFVSLPLYLYDHSGITISTEPFSCPWDSGRVGLIYATEEDLKEFPGPDAKEKLLDCLRSEVKVYDQYLTGDVHGWVIEDDDGEEVDSCWGYYGEEDCRQEGEKALERLMAPVNCEKGTADEMGRGD